MTDKEFFDQFHYNVIPATSTKPNAGMTTITRKDTAPMPNPPDKINHKYTDQIVCPYCGYEHHDCWEIRGDNGKYDCGDCGKEFQYERLVTVEYCTKKIKPNP